MAQTISSDTERALFKLFVKWLIALGTVLVIIAGGAWALIYRVVITDTQSQALILLDQTITNLRKEVGDIDGRINNLVDKAHESVESIKIDEGRAEVNRIEIEKSLKNAKSSVTELQLIVNASKDIINASNSENIVKSIVSDNAFLQLVTEKTTSELSKVFDGKTTDLKSQLNRQFLLLTTATQNGYAFSNTEPENNGGGYNPDVPPGRCPMGSFVAGIQPYKYESGIREIRFRCATIPLLSVQ